MCLFRFFVCLKVRLLVFLLLSGKNSLHILDISPLSSCFGNIFSQTFHLLNGAFWRAIVFNSEGSPIYFFNCSCLTQGHSDFLLFYSRSYRVCALTLRSFIHFELFLYTVWDMDWGSFVGYMDIQWFQRHLFCTGWNLIGRPY